MAISDYISGRYVEAVFREEAEIIYREQQRAVVREGLRIETGELSGSLRAAAFSVEDRGGGKRLTMRYVQYMRFLDMKKVSIQRRKSYQIYNKIVFGRIYQKMYVKIMYGFTKDTIREMKKLITNEQK